LKRLISILLIFSFFLPFWGQYFFLKIEKKKIKNEIRLFLASGPDADELVYLAFSIKESKERLRWEHSKEFEFAGEMYDIIKRTDKADSVFFVCWLDKKETELNHKLNNLVNGELNKRNKDKSNLLTIFFSGLFHTSNRKSISSPDNISVSYYSYINNKHFNADITKDTPPPRAV